MELQIAGHYGSVSTKVAKVPQHFWQIDYYQGYPTEIYIGQKANLPKPSFVQADNIHTVSKNRLEWYLGTLDKESMLEISRKVVLALKLEGCLFEN